MPPEREGIPQTEAGLPTDQKRTSKARIKEDLTSSSLSNLLLNRNVYLQIQVFPLNHHNHFQDIKEIAVVSLVRCDYIVTGPIFICGLRSDVLTWSLDKRSLLPCDITATGKIDAPSPTCATAILGSSSRTCPSLGPCKTFHS